MDVTLVRRQRFDDLRIDDQLLPDRHHCRIVVVDAGVVRTGRYRDQVVGEPLHPLWADRMRPDHHTEVIPLHERIQVIGTEVDDVVLLLWVSDIVVLEPGHILALIGITPQQVDDLLVVIDIVGAQLYLERSLYLLDAVDVGDAWAQATMATEDPLLFVGDDGSEGHVLECFVDLGEAAVGVVDVFAESLGALLAESEVLVDELVLVVSSHEIDLLGVLELQSHQEADDLQAVLALVHVVTKEQVVIRVYIS